MKDVRTYARTNVRTNVRTNERPYDVPANTISSGAETEFQDGYGERNKYFFNIIMLEGKAMLFSHNHVDMME